MNRLKHQAPKGHRVNRFRVIRIKGFDIGYCSSHNFYYDKFTQNQLRYNAMPCIHTDSTYEIDKYFMGGIYLGKPLSLKACIRKVRNIKGLPDGAIAIFETCEYIKGKDIFLAYKYKVNKPNLYNPSYQINKPEYLGNFFTCVFSIALVEALRKNGFLVKVFVYKDFEEDVETALAYGNGKIIGFSALDKPLFGYYNGTNSVLWDRLGELDKWSNAKAISKKMSIDEILSILIKKDEVALP